MIDQPCAMTIAGSDSGGGAGIQADLKTFAALEVYGACAITCLTAQNPGEVTGVHPAPAPFVGRQIRTAAAALPVRAAKTGMLYSAAIIDEVVAAVADIGGPPLVVDPVMVASSGARLLEDAAVASIRDRLFPAARIITPNLPEAEILCGEAVTDLDGMRAAAAHLAGDGVACLVKGGHLSVDGDARRDEVVDVLCPADGAIIELRAPWINGVSTHGSGCTLSAAIAAGLALGDDVPTAVRRAHRYLARALASPVRAWDVPSIHHLWRLPRESSR